MRTKQRVPERLRRQVRERARGYCEYCLVHEDDLMFPFQADHIIAEQHHGATNKENLAWTCGICNRFKGPNIASIDPDTAEIIPLFHPRKQQWQQHFRLNGPYIEPLTACGRATGMLLLLNSPERIAQRLALMSAGRFQMR